MRQRLYEYLVARPAGAPPGPREELARAVAAGSLSLPELERRYFTLVYDQSGRNLQEAARRLGCDWRTIRAKLDPAFLDALARSPA